VVWTDEHTAFTAPGRTIYISRRLLERLADDDATAFVVAHEIAHHQLGHLPEPLTALRHVPLHAALRILRGLVVRPEREREADLVGIQSCVDAGYDPDRCVAALAHLSNVLYDYGDVDGVLGSERGEVRIHPPMAARIAAVREHLAAMSRGDRISPEALRARDRKRARNAKLIAAGSAALTIAVFLLGRRRR
jgi:predicted Zn-dependent protease